jgi:dethiobiotin synthetase
MNNAIFITGTDTGCGKTEITLGLMQALQLRGESVLGMKPVASGAQLTDAGLRNEDALRIQAQCSGDLSYEQVNPFAYEPPIAPHLAAETCGRPIELERIEVDCRRLAEKTDQLIVEGVGGWLVPLTDDATVADLATQLQMTVILVVGLRLGCLNHALLTEAVMRRQGVPLLGWVANQVEPGMVSLEGNLANLRERLNVPCLGVVPWLGDPSPEAVARYLDIDPILNRA